MMKINLRKLVEKGTLYISLFGPFLVLADTAPTPPTSPINSVSDLTRIGCNVANWVFWFFILATVIFILIAAFNYLTAGGDAEKVAAANHQLVYAAIAVVVALIARAFPSIVSSFVGGQQINSC